MNIYDPLRRDITRKIAIMLQRTFALYGDETVIINVMNALQEIGERGGKTQGPEKSLGRSSL